MVRSHGPSGALRQVTKPCRKSGTFGLLWTMDRIFNTYCRVKQADPASRVRLTHSVVVPTLRSSQLRVGTQILMSIISCWHWPFSKYVLCYLCNLYSKWPMPIDVWATLWLSFVCLYTPVTLHWHSSHRRPHCRHRHYYLGFVPRAPNVLPLLLSSPLIMLSNTLSSLAPSLSPLI